MQLNATSQYTQTRGAYCANLSLLTVSVACVDPIYVNCFICSRTRCQDTAPVCVVVHMCVNKCSSPRSAASPLSHALLFSCESIKTVL